MSFILRVFLFLHFFALTLFSENEKIFSVKSLPVRGKSEIFLIEKRAERITHIKNLSKNFPGNNYDPYLFFYKNSPSVIWVNQNKEVQSLILYFNEEFTQYILDLSFEISNPVAEEDSSGKLLLLIPSPCGVFYSFPGNDFLSFDSFFNSPSFYISAKRDGNGMVWIAWSGFDGNDWEIYLTKWDGSNFSPVERITDNNSQDIEPSISIEPFDIQWKSYEAGEISLKNRRELFLHEREESKEFFEMDINSFIAFGDSITYGMVDYKPEAEGYVPRLERLFQEEYSKDIKVLNRGVPGEDTVAGLSRIERVIEEDSSLYILIMEGTNDVWHYPAWFTAINLEEMIKISLSHRMRPLIANIIPKAFWAEYLNPRIEEINKFITQIAEEYKIPLVDQYNAFMSYPEEKGGWRALYSGHNHPNELGYQLMAEVWFDAISKLPRFKEKEINWRNERNKKDKFDFGVGIQK